MKSKKKSGIYCIINLKNNKRYIGQAVNLEIRRKRHFRELEKNYHTNKHLQNAYNKYGKEFFRFNILIYCETFELTRYEQFFVDSYSPEVLYNKHLECVNSPFGTKHTEEAKKKMSKAQSGKIVSEDTRRKLSKVRTGKKHSEETKRKMSQNHKDVSGKNNPMYGKKGEKNPNWGRKHSEETRKKMSKAQLGKTVSKETKRKISQTRINKGLSAGKNNPNYGKGLFGEKNGMYGKNHSDEARKKMSDANIGEKCPNSKLKEKDVLDIYILLENGILQKYICEKYNISRRTVYDIKIGKIWKHLYDNFQKGGNI